MRRFCRERRAPALALKRLAAKCILGAAVSGRCGPATNVSFPDSTSYMFATWLTTAVKRSVTAMSCRLL